MRSVLRLVPVAVLVLLPVIAFAAPRAAVPSLTVQGDDGSVALALESVRIDVLLRGHLARTTFELTYRNSLGHDVNGDFSFPLPPDGEVSDLALYFGSHLRHAVAVERVQARRAYDETVHAGVDPALAEWSASTRAFHFQVYPIPAKGTKVVHIAYDQELTNAPYELDLRYDATLASVELSIDGEDARVESDGLPLRRTADGWGLREKNVRLNGIVRATRRDTEVALVAFASTEKTWYASAPLQIRSEAQPAAPAPEVLLLLDASASAVQRDGVKLQEFLRAFVAQQKPAAGVTVVPFHIAVDRPLQSDAAGLERTLAGIDAAGATDLAELLTRLPALASAAPPDTRIVLVTDGINSLGDAQRLARAVDSAAKLRRPLTIVNVSPAANDHFLGGLARATGGWYLDLTHIDVAEALRAAMRVPVRLDLIAGQPTIRDVLPATLLATNDLTVTVNARSADRMVVLPVLDGRTRHDVPVRELSTREEVDLVRRAWARAKLRALLDRGGVPAEVLEHGRTFQQLTPQTSLLVLDSWQAYEQYGIPLTPDLREERDADLAAVAAAERSQREDRNPVVDPGTSVPMPANVPPPPLPASAPAGSWIFRGTIVESYGYPLPGVTVTLATPTDHHTTVTNDLGQYTFIVPRPPSFTLTAELAGFGTVSRNFPQGTANLIVVDLVMAVATITETITVTAEAPTMTVMGVASMTGGRFADDLLSSLQPNAPLFDDTAILQKPIAERLALVEEALAKLDTLTSLDDRFRYYAAARAVLGGTRLFQARAALALRKDAPELAVRWLTDLAEAYPDDAPTLRLIGRVLDGWGYTTMARLLFERALELAPRETQTWRELILLAAKEGRTADLADLRRRYAGYERDERMGQTDQALALELQRLHPGADARRDDAAELQVELMWDENYTDIDLHVLEPSGEEVWYSHLTSKSGGRLSTDVTAGFGPETYTEPRLAPGPYVISVAYYNADDTRQTLVTFAHLIVYVRGERQDYFVPLTAEKEKQVVATVGK